MEYIKRSKMHSLKIVYLPWGDKKNIPLDSDKYQNIGDSMEDGHGLIATSELVNEFRCADKSFK